MKDSRTVRNLKEAIEIEPSLAVNHLKKSAKFMKYSSRLFGSLESVFGFLSFAAGSMLSTGILQNYSQFESLGYLSAGFYCLGDGLSSISSGERPTHLTFSLIEQLKITGIDFVPRYSTLSRLAEEAEQKAKKENLN